MVVDDKCNRTMQICYLKINFKLFFTTHNNNRQSNNNVKNKTRKKIELKFIAKQKVVRKTFYNKFLYIFDDKSINFQWLKLQIGIKILSFSILFYIGK